MKYMKNLICERLYIDHELDFIPKWTDIEKYQIHISRLKSTKKIYISKIKDYDIVMDYQCPHWENSIIFFYLYTSIVKNIVK